MPKLEHAPLIGRRAELALLAKVLDSAASGSGGTVFLAGEGGIGKTLLAATVAERAEREGWRVATGRAYSVESGVPYAVFSDALLPLLRTLEPSTLTVLTRGAAAELAYIFPNLALPGSADRASAGATPSELKSRLLWNFSQFLGRLAAKQPLLIVLDNLQWADSSSLELLHFLARNVEAQRVVLLGTYNEAERDLNPILRSTEQSLLRLGAVVVHRVGPLLKADVEEAVLLKFGGDASATQQLSARLYEWTRGNPFFLEETLKSLIESGANADRGRWTAGEVETLRVPATIREVLKARVDRLSPNSRTLANLAAAIGTRTSYDTLASVSGLSERELVVGLEELVSHRVIEETGTVDDIWYDFSHPLLQQVVYAELGQARARQLHATIAETLEELYSETASAHADELAFHFARAHAPRLALKAVRYLHAAGTAAIEKYANREAATYLATALEHVDRDKTIPDSTRAEILTTLARTRQRLGEYDEALALWSRALERALRRGDKAVAADVQHRMGLACYWSGRHAHALAHFSAGLAAVDETGDRATLVRLRLARAIALQDLGHLKEAQLEVESALESAAEGELNNDALLSRAHRALLLLYTWTGPLDLAREHGNKALLHAKAAGAGMLEWTAQWGMALLEGVSGDAQQFREHLDASERLAEQLHSPILPLWSAELRVQYLSGTGDWDAAIEIAERTIAQAKKLNQRTLLPRLYVWSGLIYLWRGNEGKAKQYFDEAWKLAGAEKAGSLDGAGERALDVPSIVPAHLGLASYYLARGDTSQAVQIGEAGLEIADRTGYMVWALQWLLPTIGDAALSGRRFKTAETHLERMRRDAGRLNHRLGLAYADACEGLLARFRDHDPARAIELLKSAAEQLEALPFPPQAARVRRRLAGAFLEVGDRDEAMRQLRDAHDIFARIGATVELAGTREEMRELGLRPPPRTITSGAGGLTGRELEIARMVAARKSNKEIGGALEISARTVSTHLSNIFGKLNVASRGELADFVRQNGLLE